ncbi:MAG: hydrogenase maturation nickel metallochaperone HypA [Clostridiales bacterium]|nr:hydrogenase maturation nickel metallochaperone HypA [Clostridiales bacterium]MCF8021809.1 hydrogenase maturation nickel metallochaperone HypA [Clostridiales bacterium]
MHELSLIQNLMEIVNESAAENDITQVHKVKLVIGESHGALPDALDFAFQILTENTICAGAVLEVEKKPVIIKCKDCNAEFKPEGISYRCTACSSMNVKQISGRELYIDYYEGD